MKVKKKTKVEVDPENIKYRIHNTELHVIITKDNKVYFDVDPKDEKAILNKDKDKISEYQEKVKKTMEYLYLEGFLSESIEN